VQTHPIFGDVLLMACFRGLMTVCVVAAISTLNETEDVVHKDTTDEV
jgi:hypothetical protein